MRPMLPLRSKASPAAALFARSRAARIAGTAIESDETLGGHLPILSLTNSSVLQNRRHGTATEGRTVFAA